MKADSRAGIDTQHDPALRDEPKGPIWPCLVGMVLPTIMTWLYFDLLATSLPIYQQLAASIGKVVQFGVPLLAYGMLLRSRKRHREERHPASISSASKSPVAPRYGKSALAGVAFGFIVSGAMIAIYFLVLAPLGLMSGPKAQAMAKVKEIGIGSTAIFIGVGVFYSLFHSALEEYYWRWFIFRELERRLPLAPAAMIGGLGFMAHHVLVLARYFGWDSPLTWLFSLGIAIGGAVWALLYRQWGTLLGPWLSHLLVDAAIFGLGYHLLFC